MLRCIGLVFFLGGGVTYLFSLACFQVSLLCIYFIVQIPKIFTGITATHRLLCAHQCYLCGKN